MIPMDLQTTWPWMRVFLSLAVLFLANSSLLANQSLAEANRGDLGGDMSILAQFHTPPPSPAESNHFIDMWSGGEVANFARSHGLTNNRALFVVSHARALRTKGRLHYALYPGQTKISRGTKGTFYSPKDMARMLGPQTVNQIDNLIISGCNSENVFDLAEWKACFPHATNITHAAPGKDGYELLLRHALIYRSQEIQWLYGMPDSFKPGQFDENWAHAKNRPKLNLYVASLYKPGATAPFAARLAGRELLDPAGSVETLKVVAPTPPAARTEPVAAPVVVQPKVAAAREPIIIRRPPPPEPDRSAPALSAKAAQGHLAMSVVGIVFGGWCIIWSLGNATASSGPEPITAQDAEMQCEAAPKRKRELAAKVRKAMATTLCKFRKLFVRAPRAQQSSAEATSQTNAAESTDQVG